MRRPGPTRAPLPAVDAELAGWVAAEAERRVVGRRLVVESALRLLREAIARAPDLVALPPPPRPPGRRDDQAVLR